MFKVEDFDKILGKVVKVNFVGNVEWVNWDDAVCLKVGKWYFHMTDAALARRAATALKKKKPLKVKVVGRVLRTDCHFIQLHVGKQKVHVPWIAETVMKIVE